MKFIPVLLSLVFFVGPLGASDPLISSSESPNIPNSLELAKDESVTLATKTPGDMHEYHGSKELYRQTITELENTYGVYDNRLVEQLVGLGLAEKSQGEEGAAIGAFKRAFHIKRVNSGLYSLDQVSILSHLIESYVAIEDWRSANDKQSLVYNIQQHSYGEGSPKLLAPINNMVKWHLIAFNRGSSILHLLRAMDLNKKAIAIIEKHYGVHDPRLNETLYRQALASYHLSEYQNHSQQFSQPNSISQPLGMSQTQGRTLPISPSDSLPTYGSPYRDGKKALLRRVNLFQSNPQLSVSDHAEALVQLGDWYFLFDKKESAMDIYTEAIKLLSDKDQEHLAKQIFDRPRALNFAMPFDDIGAKLDKKKQKGFVRVKFTVTPGGRTQNIEIVESSPPNVKDIQVFKSVKSTRYRPRIIEGKPVLAKDVMEKHIFDF